VASLRLNDPTEKFRTRWGGWLVSSRGFGLKINYPTTLRYRDAEGELVLGCEVIYGPRYSVRLYQDTWPPMSSPRRWQIVDNIRRAFASKDWDLYGY